MIVTYPNDQIWDILEIAEAYIRESQHPYTYNRDNSLFYIKQLLADPASAIFLDYCDITQRVRGGAIAHCARDFKTEWTGFISYMYVMPRFRGSLCGRTLMKEIVNWFDLNQCIISFSSPAAHIGQDQRYVNLLKKFGYILNGRALVRPLGG